jgi:hypothetical protein
MKGQTQHQVLRRESDISRIDSKVIRGLHDYWQGKRRGDSLPSWSEIDPAEISAFLPNLIVVAIEREPFRVFYRLVGTQIVEFRGEVTGHYLDSIPWSAEAARTSVQESFQKVVETRRPTFAEVDITTRAGAQRRMYGAIWPLARAGDGVIDRCLAAEDYGDLTRGDLA